MSLGLGMSSGLRALSAARLGMQTAGNNVANANTKGYSRQRIELSAALPFGIGRGMQIGTGVEVGGISRLVDGGLERRLQLQLGLMGTAELDHSRLGEIEGILAEPDGGLSESLASLFGSIDQLRTDPADRALRGGVTQAASQLSQNFRLVADRFQGLAGSSFNEIRGLVRQVNERVSAIADLNRQIVGIEANGSAANDLRDSRAQHIKEIGRLLDANVIERPSGSIDLIVGGSLLVAGDRAASLNVGKDGNGRSQVTVGNAATPATLRSGRIAGLLAQEQGKLPEIVERIDRLARNAILEMNRIHSTGMPRSGPFQALSAANSVQDRNGSGRPGDELLAQAGLPFDVQSGSLYVAVTDLGSNTMRRTRIDIDPRTMTLDNLAAQLSAIPNLNASVDPTGRLRIAADAGYGFDFSPRLEPNPDAAGSFGGMLPSIGSRNAGPFDLSGQTFPVQFTVTTGTATAPVTTTISLDANEFVNPGAATPAELAAAINRDLGSNGSASAVGGRLVLQAAEGGASAQLALANVGGGTALTALSLSSAVASGRDLPLKISVEGTYTGSDNRQLTFVPDSDGQVGQDQDLRVRVLDQNGNLVTTINVGQGYEPGKPIDIGNGVKVSFGPGTVSATNGNVFALETLADSDTSDVLVALGINSFFRGSSSTDIEVDPSLLANPDRLAAGIGRAEGDAGNLARLTNLRSRNVDQLDQNTIEDFYADLVGDIGFDTAAAANTLTAEQKLMDFLENERERISGVNIDEEMVDMLRFQQSYDAAARFIAIAQEMTSTLINLGR